MKVTRRMRGSDGEVVLVVFNARQGESTEWISSCTVNPRGDQDDRQDAHEIVSS